MALTIDHATLVITVPQADLTLVGGTFYRMDSETYFRKNIIELLDNEDHMVLQDAILHNTEVTISGVTYARFIELINGYSVTFTPDSAWTVEIIGSNNNLHDVQANILNQNNVQVIPTNSAGLITVVSGSGVTQQDKDDIEAQIFAHLYEGAETFQELLRLMRALAAGDIVQLPDGTYKIKSIDGLKDRIEGDDSANSGRAITSTDVT